MSKAELRRVEVLARVKSGELKLRDAAKLLGRSYRQTKRLWRRYRRHGAEGLKHGNAGKASNRAYPKKLRQRVLRLVREKYSGDAETRFGPTLAAEHLAGEDGIEVDSETLRRWMLKDGLWSRQRRRRQHRRQRERKAHFGELVQLDGSFHEWLEGRGPGGCLMNMVDDATGTTLCRLGEQETTWAAANVLEAWIEAYGVPLALYTDWKNVYVREPTEKEMLRGEAAVTQFGRMCQRLGIRIVAANSAQAKGRVERNHGTQQDRLIKKMRRKGICSHAAANEYFEREYLAGHNARYAVAAAQPEDYHRKRPGRKELREVFRLETERTIANNWVVRYENRYFQLARERQHYAPAKAKVLVCEWQDGTIEIEYRGRRLKWEEVAAPVRGPQAAAAAQQRRRSRRGSAGRPAEEHPWRQGYQGIKVRRPAGRAATIFRKAASASP